MRFFYLAIAFCVTAFAISTPVAAQNNPFREHPLVARPGDNPFPEPQLDPVMSTKLDGLVAKKDWSGLRGATLPLNNPTDFRKATDWLKVKTDTGGSFLIPLLYVRNLWLASQAEKDDALRNMAALMSLYTVALIQMDGMACADQTAPSHRFDQVMQGEAGAALQYLRKAAPDSKEQAIRIAVGLEAVTAPLRQSQDEILCSGGLDQIKAGMDGKLMGEPGHIGKVVEVGTPSGWKPSFVAEEVYKAKQAKERGADLYDHLWPLLK